MTKKKQSTTKVAVKKEVPKGCKNCNNTGLVGTGTTAKLCPVCNGSPFGE